MDHIGSPNPFAAKRSQTQCNWILQLIRHPFNMKIVGHVACPKEVWAEYDIEFINLVDSIFGGQDLKPIPVPQGWYCQEHWCEIVLKRKVTISPSSP